MSKKFTPAKLKSLAESLTGKELAILAAEYYEKGKDRGINNQKEVDILLSTLSRYESDARRKEYTFYYSLWVHAGFLSLDLQTTIMDLQILYWRVQSMRLAVFVLDEEFTERIIGGSITLSVWLNEVLKQYANHLEVLRSLYSSFFSDNLSPEGDLIERGENVVTDLKEIDEEYFSIINKVLETKKEVTEQQLIQLNFTPDLDNEWIEDTKNQVIGLAERESGYSWKDQR